MKLTRQSIIASLKSPGSSLQTTVLVTVVALAYAYRAHPYIRLPQLFAEDGASWLAEGYNKSITAILQPVNGFLHVPERLFGFVMARLPLHEAPLMFAVTAWILFILLAYYLFSSRTKILANNYERVFMVLCLCLVTNLYEFFFNFSNSVFLMGIVGVLIMIAKKPKNPVGAVLEKVFFFLSCFTLPFAWFYLPIALYERFKHKSKGIFYLYVSLFASIVQLLVFLASHVNRSPVTFLSLFSKFTLLELYNQMIVPAVRFARIDILVGDYTNNIELILWVALTVAMVFTAAYVVLKRSNKQVAYLLFFLATMTFASVKSPTLNVKLPVDALKTMAVVVGANRYFVYGIIAVNVIFVKSAYLAVAPRARYAFLVVFISFGLLTSLHYQSFHIDKHFTDYTVQYDQGIDEIESGKVNRVVIPVNPTSWYMTLQRH